MYQEWKIENNRIWYRGMPNAKWQEATPAQCAMYALELQEEIKALHHSRRIVEG